MEAPQCTFAVSHRRAAGVRGISEAILWTNGAFSIVIPAKQKLPRHWGSFHLAKWIGGIRLLLNLFGFVDKSCAVPFGDAQRAN
jgi:hypothetical protein